MSGLRDQFNRTHRYLRLSLTDRCNLRCVYCMPAEGLQWIPSPDILTRAEIVYLSELFVEMGIEHIRLTGGEPTIRKDLLDIVSDLASIQDLNDLSMTTNALTLSKLAAPLKDAGLKRLNISIDSLQPERFSTLTRGGKLEKVLKGIDAAYAAGFGSSDAPIKLNIVVMSKKNDDEVLDFVRFASEHPATIQPRFIEYMPFGKRLHQNTHTKSLQEQLATHTTLLSLDEDHTYTGPATYSMAKEYGVKVGFISPISNRFCSTCNRLRLSAHGDLRACLAKEPHPTLRSVIRNPDHSRKDVQTLIQNIVWGKVKGHQCATEDNTPVPFEGIMTQIGG